MHGLQVMSRNSSAGAGLGVRLYPTYRIGLLKALDLGHCSGTCFQADSPGRGVRRAGDQERKKEKGQSGPFC